MRNPKSKIQNPKSAGVLLLLFLAALLALPGSAFAQERRFHFDEYNSDINVQQNGAMDVCESLVYVFESGTFRRGIREIPLERVESIDGVRVFEERNGQLIEYRQTTFDPDESTTSVPQTFGTMRQGDLLRIRWIYGDTSNTTRTFRVCYTASGAIRVYDDEYELQWKAVPADLAINSSRVQVVLPQGTTPIDTASSPSTSTSVQGSTVVWSANDPDDGLEVGVRIPKTALQIAAPPAWQQTIDEDEKVQAERERAQQDWNKRVRPILDIALLLLGALLAVGGVLWSIMRWYTHGRDNPVKLHADYLTEPPSDLPPGLVGTLLDESADVRDVISTLVDQGRKGNLSILEDQSGGVLGLFSQRDFQYVQTGGKIDYRFEEMVLNAIFKHGSAIRLSELKNTFYTDLPPIYEEMYKSVVALKYFPESPKAVRARNIGVGVGFFLLAGAIAFVAVMFAETFSPFLFIFPFAFGAIGLVRLITAGIMPRKTNFGAEEAAKWRAFGRYLEQMQRYTNVQAAADKFQQYLPYAVALGIERQLINQFNSVPAAMPTWYVPYGYGPTYYPVGTHTTSTESTPAGAGGGGAAGPMPGLDPGQAVQGMSDSLANAMQGMSDSFTSMVNSAANVLTSAPSSSGSSGGSSGGWGGGGGSFGGGGGGGGSAGAD